LPRNLGSTGTVFEKPKVGAIGGLNLKLEYNVRKEKPINIFILSEENKKYEGVPSQSYNNTHRQLLTQQRTLTVIFLNLSKDLNSSVLRVMITDMIQ